ncbi:MAG: hypothetical protein GXO07_04875 [Crenarchaeota archaeon]|nr:hypothetical protein [Thermoproteota archaeon]
MRASLLLLGLLLAAPALAENYIALTLSPGAGGVAITYTYRIEVSAGPLSLSNSDVITAANVPYSTTISITQTPTLIWPIELEGEIYVTAQDSNGNVATGRQSFTMMLEPDKTNTLNIDISLTNGGSITGEVVLYVAKLSIPFAGLLAVGLAALLGRRMKRN